MKVEVAYALPDRQTLIELEVDAGTTARAAVLASGVLERHPEIDLETSKLGVFGRVVDAEHELDDGDRVEIYRPLRADPREVRRRLAAEGRSIGGGRKAGT